MPASLPHRSYLDGVYAIVKRFPENIAFEVASSRGYQTTTYAELLRQVEHTAAELHSMCIGPGDRVALLLDNHPRWCTCFLAILHRRAVAVPLDVHYTD